MDRIQFKLVVVWVSFVGRDGKKKDSWLIGLGKTGLFDLEKICLVGRTTTKLQYYTKGGERESHLTVRFKEGHCIFSQECLLDIDADIRELFPSDFEGLDVQINSVGELSEQEMRQIHNRIEDSKSVPVRWKNLIHDTYTKNGIMIKRKQIKKSRFA